MQVCVCWCCGRYCMLDHQHWTFPFIFQCSLLMKCKSCVVASQVEQRAIVDDGKSSKKSPIALIEFCPKAIAFSISKSTFHLKFNFKSLRSVFDYDWLLTHNWWVSNRQIVDKFFVCQTANVPQFFPWHCVVLYLSHFLSFLVTQLVHVCECGNLFFFTGGKKWFANTHILRSHKKCFPF